MDYENVNLVSRVIGAIRDPRRTNRPDALVAGGWARDTILGQVPRDVDIWTRQHISLDGLRAALGGFNYSLSRPITMNNIGGSRVKTIIKAEVEGLTVDFIQVTQPTNNGQWNPVDRFDFGICQAWFDGELFQTTENFDKDVRDKTVTFLCTDENLVRFKRIRNGRIDKMIRKFPDHRLVGIVEHGGVWYPQEYVGESALQEAVEAAQARLTTVEAQTPVPEPLDVSVIRLVYGYQVALLPRNPATVDQSVNRQLLVNVLTTLPSHVVWQYSPRGWGRFSIEGGVNTSTAEYLCDTSSIVSIAGIPIDLFLRMVSPSYRLIWDICRSNNGVAYTEEQRVYDELNSYCSSDVVGVDLVGGRDLTSFEPDNNTIYF